MSIRDAHIKATQYRLQIYLGHFKSHIVRCIILIQSNLKFPLSTKMNRSQIRLQIMIHVGYCCSLYINGNKVWF